ncbi:hypothetical protein Pmani_002314 [Petrolisthes manimaculis]|uniref:Uncharacterized protein n=1 Tax=Petrolisthes manimaculis TaxID=1843537 RepID=A0AAE1UKH8_9EUCA|nr:hypothetical protein Pmani_002314 [Petrolisthes manimaculis]
METDAEKSQLGSLAHCLGQVKEEDIFSPNLPEKLGQSAQDSSTKLATLLPNGNIDAIIWRVSTSTLLVHIAFYITTTFPTAAHMFTKPSPAPGQSFDKEDVWRTLWSSLAALKNSSILGMN